MTHTRDGKGTQTFFFFRDSLREELYTQLPQVYISTPAIKNDFGKQILRSMKVQIDIEQTHSLGRERHISSCRDWFCKGENDVPTRMF